MLNDKEYFAEFPDEDPARRQVLLSAKLVATLRALEKELRPYLPQPVETDAEAGDPSGIAEPVETNAEADDPSS